MLSWKTINALDLKYTSSNQIELLWVEIWEYYSSWLTDGPSIYILLPSNMIVLSVPITRDTIYLKAEFSFCGLLSLFIIFSVIAFVHANNFLQISCFLLPLMEVLTQTGSQF